MAPMRGQMVCSRSEVSTVSPHCSPPPPIIRVLHASSVISAQGSCLYMVCQVVPRPSRYHTPSVDHRQRYPFLVASVEMVEPGSHWWMIVDLSSLVPKCL